MSISVNIDVDVDISDIDTKDLKDELERRVTLFRLMMAALTSSASGT